jgi:uncharacterized membrane protein
METVATGPNDAPAVVRLTKRLEQQPGLDGAVGQLRKVSDVLLRSPRRADALRGMWLGHAIHPLLTDLPLGMWMSANVLDLLGGRRSRPAAELLIGAGLAAAVPTAVTGVAEWGTAQQREQRVGVAHAAANSVSLGLYATSLMSRRKGRYATGKLLALCGGLTAIVGGYLGGHLVEVRKLSSRHPSFVEPDA